jgi:hypothetical protein
MEIILRTGYLRHLPNDKGLSGSRLKVETDYLYENQYNAVLPCGAKYCVYDVDVQTVIDDVRSSIYNTSHRTNGELPDLGFVRLEDTGKVVKIWGSNHIEILFENGFTLSCYQSLGYYRFTNHRQTNFNFIYHKGIFFEESIGYNKVNSFKGKVRLDMVADLKQFMLLHHPSNFS